MTELTEARAMLIARMIVEAHINTWGMIPHPDFLKESIAASLRRAAARVEAPAPQEDGWQDISTLSLPIPEGRGHMVDLHVRGLHRQYRMPNVWRDHGEWCYVSEGPKVLTIRDDLVTHWRPLPAAPPVIAGR